MSAEPPDSRGMGWAWKCRNMSDTVWNHRWWTWHCPFSFTDKRKCWEGVRFWFAGMMWEGWVEKERIQKEKDNSIRHSQRPKIKRTALWDIFWWDKLTACQGRHQRKWWRLILPQRCWRASAGIMLYKNTKQWHYNIISRIWAASSSSQMQSLSEFNTRFSTFNINTFVVLLKTTCQLG